MFHKFTFPQFKTQNSKLKIENSKFKIEQFLIGAADNSTFNIQNSKLLRFLRQIFFNDEVVDDEVLSFWRILAHIVGEKFLHLVGLV